MPAIISAVERSQHKNETFARAILAARTQGSRKDAKSPTATLYVPASVPQGQEEGSPIYYISDMGSSQPTNAEGIGLRAWLTVKVESEPTVRASAPVTRL